MKKIKIYTLKKKISGDLLTPVSIYLKVRDRYREPLLLESSDYHSGKNSRSFICFEPLAGIIVKPQEVILKKGDYTEKKMPGGSLNNEIENFLQHFETTDKKQVVFGYSSYEAVQLMEDIELKHAQAETEIPLAVYSLYKNSIVVNHFNDEVEVTCNAENENDLELQFSEIENLLLNKTVTGFSFTADEEEISDNTDEQYLAMVKEAKKHCKRGDVFQLVLSRRFSRKFKGDEFNVYRQLRRINPSPYLFYFDHGNFKLFGSSPEAQLVVENNKAEIHPIAGTYKRTENDAEDLKAIERLQNDKKENAEHMMLVDLSRNDLSRHCRHVKVETLKEAQIYSHVIHLVSKVTGELKENSSAYKVLCDSFPAGTLSGAPKHKAMQLIDIYERTPRSFYGGTVGMIGLDGTLNHAIMIRTFLSKDNTLYYRAGAGIVDSSVDENEMHEVFNKIGALRKAIELASKKETTKKEKQLV
ncbi:MAG TPA: anthranilate synthase component I family protein [Bacteroidia bacterium]|jgi:anthranilate synthase component 1|nr:anthranilate synthase component I family protein [Bacteroidia bacterium]